MQAQQALLQAQEAQHAARGTHAQVATLRQQLAFKTQESAELAALCEELVSDIEARNTAAAVQEAEP